MAYGVIDVAKHIINESIESGNPVNNLKLQKLLYYVQAASLVRFGEPIFEEDLLVWKWGVVSREVYNMYSPYTYKNIEDKQYGKYIEHKYQKLINEVVDAKKYHTAFDLNYEIWKEKPIRNTPYHGIISIESMTDFFSKLNNASRIWEGGKEEKGF